MKAAWKNVETPLGIQVLTEPVELSIIDHSSDIARALQVNLTYPGESLGSRRARMGPRATRTSLIPLAFSMLNTGDFGRDVKASGK